MTQDRHQEADNAGKRARIPEAERQERLAQLVLCRSKLSARQALLLGELFPEIFAAHHDQVWSWLQRRGLSIDEVEDLLQETFLVLHSKLLKQGFPDSLAATLRVITAGKVLNYQRARRRAPESVGLPSSGSEKPRSGPDAERTLALRELAQHLVDQLSPEHQSVIDAVMFDGLSQRDAAAMLDLPEGTVKSRLIAAKRELLALAEKLLPPSQRNAT
jgi:RNA polymerase sigma factor (sigma-70 family)